MVGKGVAKRQEGEQRVVISSMDGGTALISDDLPSRESINLVLKQLIEGDITREQASDWAMPWVTRLELFEDSRVREALTSLSFADLPSTDRRYLYGQVDFVAWLEEFAGSSEH